MTCGDKFNHCQQSLGGGTPADMSVESKQQCPTCGGFLRADGGCTKCEQASTDQNQVFLTYEKDGYNGEQVEAVFETESMAIDHIIKKHFGSNSFYKGLSREELERDAREYIDAITMTRPPRPQKIAESGRPPEGIQVRYPDKGDLAADLHYKLGGNGWGIVDPDIDYGQYSGDDQIARLENDVVELIYQKIDEAVYGPDAVDTCYLDDDEIVQLPSREGDFPEYFVAEFSKRTRGLSPQQVAIAVYDMAGKHGEAEFERGKQQPPEISPPKWKTPSWWRTKLDETVTDEQIEAWRQETEECNAHNKAEAARRDGYREQAREILTAIYGHHSRQLKYFDREKPARPPILNFKYDVEHKVRDLREKAAKKAAAKKKELENNKKTQEAISWLAERGLTLDNDFSLETAIARANDIASDEEIERRMASGGPFEFDGNSECSAECDGWDGVSKRCNCGNRRVSWVEGWDHSFKDPYVYAEAN